jgi:N-acetylmuramoyl-L-alanine amidase
MLDAMKSDRSEEPMIDPIPKGLDAVSIARRSFLAASAILLAGCATTGSPSLAGGDSSGDLPDGAFPGGRYDDLPVRRSPAPAQPRPKSPVKQASVEPVSPGGVIPRSRWAKGGPDLGDINPMLPVKSLTIHHEGWEPFVGTDLEDTAARIEQVRVGHRNAKGGGYADIGYHYIIDRDGRVWEGRSLKYQGAHVRNHNEGNIGIMCLGNFEEQAPTERQLVGLSRQVRAVMARHKIPIRRVYTHREWPNAQTLCPGRSLQAWVVKARSKSFA